MKIRLHPHRWNAGMLRFVCGETGSGKTKSLTGIMIDELQSSNRVIVHCAPFRLTPWVNGKGIAYPGLLETLEREFGDTFDAARRLVCLTEDDEIKQFWRCRPRLPEDPAEPLEMRWMPPIEDGRFRMDGSVYSGICYIINEAHEYFPASSWPIMEKSGALSWAAANRRAGDDAWVETQFPEQVAKPFRRQSVRCRVMTNHVYLNIGPFRQPDVITFKEYRATPPDKSDPALQGGKLEWKRGLLEACYDTGGGAGVSGTGADIGGRAKGLHWAFLPLGIFAIFILCCLTLAGCRKAIIAALQGKKPAAQAHQAAPQRTLDDYVNAAIAKALGSNLAAHSRSPSPLDQVRRVAEPTNVVIAVSGNSDGSYAVMFSDGLLIHARQVVDLGRSIDVDGTFYPRAGLVFHPAQSQSPAIPLRRP